MSFYKLDEGGRKDVTKREASFLLPASYRKKRWVIPISENRSVWFGNNL
jgi:hypothetical protein